MSHRTSTSRTGCDHTQRHAALWLLVVFCLCAAPEFAHAQQNNQQNVGGIAIDPAGVISTVVVPGRSAGLTRKRMESAVAKLPGPVARSSDMRMVSLNRLERECENVLADGGELSREVFHVAGLQRIDFVFVLPESDDLVIAGPAEGFAEDASGRMVGITTGRPVLRLDDLVVALRAARQRNVIGCSIDPVRERLASMQQYIAANGAAASVQIAQRRYHEMARILGQQDVSVFGVPDDSHFARSLVEADFWMKRISIGLDRPRVRGFVSHLSMIRPGGNSLRRWWFVPLYEPLETTEDGNAFAITGQRAQLLSQEEYTDATGKRFDASASPLSTEKFAQHFTDKFPELTGAVPSFAELQNLFDLAVVTALIKEHRLDERVGWTQSLFLDLERMVIPTGVVPRNVPSVANYKMSGRSLVIGLVSGGVQLDPYRTVRRLRFHTSAALTERAATVTLERAEAVETADTWWWD